MNSMYDLPPEWTEGLPFEPTDEAYRAWLLAKPGRAEAYLAGMEEMLLKKIAGTAPEEAEELKALHSQLRLEFAGLPDRLGDLIEAEKFGPDEAEELRLMDVQFANLIDLALDLPDDERDQAIAAITNTRSILARLLAFWREHSGGGEMSA